MMNSDDPTDRWLDDLPPPAWMVVVFVDGDPLEELAIEVEGYDED